MKSRFSKLCLVLSLSPTLIITAQTNLVPNPSFETYTMCPYDLTHIEKTGNWQRPTFGTPDLFHTCAGGIINVPKNIFGYQTARTGSAYVGMSTFGRSDKPWGVDDSTKNHPYREYIQTRLSLPLTAGVTYYVSFYVSVADTSRSADDGMAAYFSQLPPTLSGSLFPSYAPLNVTPQVSNPAGKILNDAINWTQVSGSFVATGGEEYITIGSFKSNATATSVQRQPYGFGFGDHSYYFLDDVCVSTVPVLCGVESTVGIRTLERTYPSVHYDASTETMVFSDRTVQFEVQLLDVYGTRVAKFSSEGGNVRLSGLKPGCYVVVAENPDSLIVEKIVVW